MKKYTWAVILVLTLGLSIDAAAEWCDIKDKKSGGTLNTYRGPCNQFYFGGPWGDPSETVHIANTTRQKEIDDVNVLESAKKLIRTQRLQRIQTWCAAATGQMKDICDQILER